MIGGGKYRILLVEDNPGDAALVRHSLGDEGPTNFDLIHVERLGAAIEAVTASPFDLVVLDLSLPDSFGVESFSRLSEAAKDVPIVVLTGFEDEELGSTLVQMGAQDYVVKWQIAGRVLVRCLRYAIERQGIEQELKRAREIALEAARSKSEFLAAMSHEIRTPLNSILGMADLLSETELTSEQDRFVDTFRVAGEALLDLINGILDFSKVEAGRLELDEFDFELGLLLETTLEILAFPAHKRRLALACEVSPDVPKVVVGDPARLRQVLVNLVGNAIKFTETGEILVSVSRGSDDSEGSDRIRFAVRDSGVGISKEKLETIFDAFSQADNSITKRYGGTGLGLSLCTGLVELMGGQIWVTSEVGQGSTFTFDVRMPAARLDDVEGGPQQDFPWAGTALVAGGNTTERRVLRDVLARQGLDASEVNTAGEAVSEIRRSETEGAPYSVIMLDCRMPPDGGFAVIDALSEIPGVIGRTLMMLTSDHRTGDVTRCERLELGGWLVKPVKVSQLTDLLSGLAEGMAPSASRSIASPKLAAEMRPRRILVVDDSYDNRALIEAYLKKTQHEIQMAENGKVAIQAFKDEPFDLILMDMQMPVVDGYSAVKAIRSIEKGRGSRIPILALTAYAFKEEREHSFEVGCDGHLTKPIRKRELLQAIDRFGKCSTIVVEVDDDIRELVDGFLENRNADVPKLLEAIESEDFETVRVIGHNMKGVGRNYGFDGITEIGAELELAGKQEQTMLAQRQVAALADYLERVEVAK
jgi:signal transduction histidine kinase/HPt (histidine-containing phosphotransfer) domain-containing protein